MTSEDMVVMMYSGAIYLKERFQMWSVSQPIN